MSKEALEHVSSLMDGELSHETSLFVTRRMATDARLGQAWERFHLIRECLRSPGGKWAVTGLALELESARPAGGRLEAAAGPLQRWLKPVSGFAIAASVAVVAVLLALPAPAPDSEAGGPDAATPFISPNPLAAVPVSQAASYSGPAAANRRLNTYLLRHNQVAASAGRQGFVSFVPIVTASPVQVMGLEDLPAVEPEPASETETEPQN